MIYTRQMKLLKLRLRLSMHSACLRGRALNVVRQCNLVSYRSDSECFRSPALRCSLERVVLWFCPVLALGTLVSNWTSRTGDYSKARRALFQS
jgi:hypothetical protein